MNVTVACHALIYNSGNVLIVRRSETDEKRPLQWDLPGGIVEKGEEFNSACAREVREETGLEVEPASLKLMYAHTEHFKQNNNNVTWLIYTGNTTESEVELSYEHDMFEWVSIEEAIDRVAYERYKKALKHINSTTNT